MAIENGGERHSRHYTSTHHTRDDISSSEERGWKLGITPYQTTTDDEPHTHTISCETISWSYARVPFYDYCFHNKVWKPWRDLRCSIRYFVLQTAFHTFFYTLMIISQIYSNMLFKNLEREDLHFCMIKRQRSGFQFSPYTPETRSNIIYPGSLNDFWLKTFFVKKFSLAL